MGLACSKTAAAETAKVVKAEGSNSNSNSRKGSSASRKKSETDDLQVDTRTQSPVPASSKTPTLSRSLELKNRLLNGRKSHDNTQNSGATEENDGGSGGAVNPGYDESIGVDGVGGGGGGGGHGVVVVVDSSDGSSCGDSVDGSGGGVVDSVDGNSCGDSVDGSGGGVVDSVDGNSCGDSVDGSGGGVVYGGSGGGVVVVGGGGGGVVDGGRGVAVDPASVRDQGVVVLVRIRPTSPSEQGQQCFLQVKGSTQLHVPASKVALKEKTYNFDAILRPTTSQEEVYNVAGPKLIQNLLQGFNATMIAYGQTGSGKTFTMEGTGQDPGVIPRLCKGLFKAIKELGPSKDVSIVASYVEIYNENIIDLLQDDFGGRQSPIRHGSPTGRRLSTGSPMVSPTGSMRNGSICGSPGRPCIREGKDGVYVENVTEKSVHDEAAILALLTKGSYARTKGETRMNAASSRSHAVLTLAIRQSPTGGAKQEEGGSTAEGEDVDLGGIRSKISLVDLAGSERAKSTGAAGQRLKEGAQINKSLSALGNVIKALTSGGNPHVPYRDSKLTRLLQDSLGGTAYTVVCCNVSPIEASEHETLSTLRFAERLKKVKNKMVVHMDPRTREIIALKRENAELRARVEQLEGVVVDGGGVEPGEGTDDAEDGLEIISPRHRARTASKGSIGSIGSSSGMTAEASPLPETPPPVPPRPVLA